MAQSEIQFNCTIKRIFNNCPKPDGWYGMFVYVPKFHRDVRLTGVTDKNLTQNMQLSVTAVPDAKQKDAEAYIWTKIEIITQTTKGTIAYLASIPGVGRLTAQIIVNRFGTDSVKVLTTDIDRAKIACNLSDRQASALRLGLAQMGAKNDLQTFVPELSSKQLEYILHNMQNPIQQIQDNPYSLCDIPGIRFATADAIALRLGFDPISPFRVNHGITEFLKTMNGHSFVNLSNDAEFKTLYCGLEKLLNIKFSGFGELAQRIRAFADIPVSPIVLDIHNGQTHLYSRENYIAVDTIVNMLQMLKHRNRGIPVDPYAAINDYERKHGIMLNREQRDAVVSALTNQCSVITGGPGRGKTLVVDCIANAWTIGKPVLLAPTGKASAKLNDMTKRRFQKTTMTIDKLLVFQRACAAAEAHNKSIDGDLNKPDNLVIVDESSMLDTRKAAELLRLMNMCQFCFIGDKDQLPSIDPGNVFHDIIDSDEFPVTKLIVPMRNSGLILSNAEKINSHDTGLSYDYKEMPFYPYENDDNDTLHAIIDCYNDELNDNPDITQIALLSPITKGDIGTIRLNIAIQDIMCPAVPDPNSIKPVMDTRRFRKTYTTKGFPIKSQMFGNSSHYTNFRIGDIVMNTENKYDVNTFIYENDDYWNGKTNGIGSHGLFNGDCGRIIGYAPICDSNTDEMIIIQLFNNQIVEIDCSSGEFESFQLGYAMTVHKAQGCEYDTVIYISPKIMTNYTFNGFASKNIVYTAVTRAKKRVVIVGSKDGLNACITNNPPLRNSTLKEKLIEKGKHYVG